MNIKEILMIIFMFVLLSVSQATYADNKPSNKSNVVFVICDDLNDAITHLGGHPQSKTPNIDKLASMGVSFSNAQSNNPICGPSRASLWSGLYPHTTGYFGYNQQKNPWRENPTLKNTVTVFEHLADNGYQVYATGKIHHNGHEDFSIFDNKDGTNGFKFDACFGPYPWDGNQKTNTWKIRGEAHPLLPEVYKKAVENCWASFGPVCNLSKTMDGKGTWLYRPLEGEYYYKSEEDRDLMPDERCVEYLKEVVNQNHRKPFFIAVGLNRPHSPLYVPQKYFDMFPLEDLKLAPYLENDLEDCTKSFDWAAHGFHKYNLLNDNGGEEMLLRWTQAYLACIAFVDEQIGEIVEAVKNSEYSDNTLIVLTSDHGYHMGEKEYIFKNTLWEESARIPLIIAGLDVAKNKTCKTPVSLIDLYPTVVDFCELDPNPNKNGNRKNLDGNSLRPLLIAPEKGEWEGNSFAITSVASSEKLEANQPGPIENQHYSIRTEEYRYILYQNRDEELYDHKQDPFEWNNLADNPTYEDVRERLKNKIIDVIAKD